MYMKSFVVIYAAMKTNVTCSLDADLVARLDAWRAPMCVGRSAAIELLLESLPEPQVESPGDQVRLYFDSNGNEVHPGIHHDNPAHDMPIVGREVPDALIVFDDPEAQGTPGKEEPSTLPGTPDSLAEQSSDPEPKPSGKASHAPRKKP